MALSHWKKEQLCLKKKEYEKLKESAKSAKQDRKDHDQSRYSPSSLSLFATCNLQGSFRQVCVKFKDFSTTSKRHSSCFQGLQLHENIDLHVKILLRKC